MGLDKNTIQAIIDELDNTEEIFIISKSEDSYKLIHSEMTDSKEWLDIIEMFLNDIKKKYIAIKGNDSAIEDIIDSADINEN